MGCLLIVLPGARDIHTSLVVVESYEGARNRKEGNKDEIISR
jgi:hypothetical protein